MSDTESAGTAVQGVDPSLPFDDWIRAKMGEQSWQRDIRKGVEKRLDDIDREIARIKREKRHLKGYLALNLAAMAVVAGFALWAWMGGGR